MNLSGIISISGQSGLFKIISQAKNGIIVEPLEGGRRFPVHGAQRVSSLEDISIYTYEEDIPLAEVFQKILQNLKDQEAISPKSSAEELKSFLETHLPNYDQEKVYVSDIKKLVQWYNALKKQGLLEDKEEKSEKKTESKNKKSAASKAEPKVKKATGTKTAKASPKASSKKGGPTKKMGSTRSK